MPSNASAPEEVPVRTTTVAAVNGSAASASMPTNSERLNKVIPPWLFEPKGENIM
jgi:hypothetical protein